MSFLAAALTWLFGNGLKIVTLPLMAVALLVAVHQAVLGHNERIRDTATRLCDAKWESEIRQQERDKAAEKARAMTSILESERQTNEELRDEIDRVRVEADKLRASAGDSANCLSDGVLDALRKKR